MQIFSRLKRQTGLLTSALLLLTCATASAQEVPAGQAPEAVETAESEPTREELLEALHSAEASAERAADAAEETRALLLQMQETEIRRQQQADEAASSPESAEQDEQTEQDPQEDSSPIGDGALRDGRWYLGGTVALSFGDRTNSPTLLENVVESESHAFRFQGIAGRLVIDRMLAVGAVLGYERRFEEGIFDSNGSVQGRGLASNAWFAGPSLRQFIRVGSTPIFFYYQADLVGGFEEESRRSTTVDSSSVRVAQTYSIALNVTPGVAVFATDYFAVELGVNVLGAELAWTKSTTDYDIPGDSFEADINLNVDLLSLQFAFVGYF